MADELGSSLTTTLNIAGQTTVLGCSSVRTAESCEFVSWSEPSFLARGFRLWDNTSI